MTPDASPLLSLRRASIALAVSVVPGPLSALLRRSFAEAILQTALTLFGSVNFLKIWHIPRWLPILKVEPVDAAYSDAANGFYMGLGFVVFCMAWSLGSSLWNLLIVLFCQILVAEPGRYLSAKPRLSEKQHFGVMGFWAACVLASVAYGVPYAPLLIVAVGQDPTVLVAGGIRDFWWAAVASAFMFVAGVVALLVDPRLPLIVEGMRELRRT